MTYLVIICDVTNLKMGANTYIHPSRKTLKF